MDRGALDAARAAGIDHGGWCPRGRRSEEGTIPERYSLRETPSADYEQRTEWNVWDSGGTLIITEGPPSGGTAYTVEVAGLAGRPVLVIDLAASPTDADPTVAIRAWLEETGVEVLNVAGPRESKRPGIQERTERLLAEALGS